MDRRQLIKYVIVVAILVPLVIEGMTLVGLVGQYLGGNGDQATPDPTADGTAVEGVREGDDLLAETARAETVSTMTLQSGSDAWTFTLSVQVRNDADTAYELRLGAVTTGAGKTVAGSATTGRVEPNGTAVVSAQWTVPSGERPERLAVTALEYDGGETVVVDREVGLGPVPVQG